MSVTLHPLFTPEAGKTAEQRCESIDPPPGIDGVPVQDPAAARFPLNISNPNPTLVRYQDGDSQSRAMASLKNGFSARS
jgi:hypothetical protein